MNNLTFTTLREANLARLPQYRNKLGALAHSEPDGSDWSPAQWLQAVIGELGEYANIRKKYERGDISNADFRVLATKELADILTYLDILAARCLDSDTLGVNRFGIDLGAAVTSKFNEVSTRVGASVFIHDDYLAGSEVRPYPPTHWAVGQPERREGTERRLKSITYPLDAAEERRHNIRRCPF